MTHARSSVGARKHWQVTTRIVCHTELTKLLVSPLMLRELKKLVYS